MAKKIETEAIFMVIPTSGLCSVPKSLAATVMVLPDQKKEESKRPANTISRA
ncbi:MULTISPECIES: hypothetical protein [Chelativorans]|uniref:hypothetical protein n=1 Tax=Chelativorans TaxID=449972 RepID=UPI0002EC8050|nr:MULTISPECIES: hypothetical protein [Chelativorans]